ncbi:MAG TPA: chemotaxis protein CheB [Candidatus Dormibacteraeota bacterium]|nr:chemotaxis protein CheB [Candidatus Dormibacteraeota bacterium]
MIGGSAGSIEALRDLVPQLPRGLPVAVFVVVHILPTSRSRLPQILERVGWLPVSHAVDGEPIVPGRILIAPPDRHLVLHADRVELNAGPRENSTRPAIDPLFRSAAAAFGSRVCGVILSGRLDDGADGLGEIAEAGGVAMVQDPREAAHPDMPRNARRQVRAAEIHTAMRLGRRIAELARAPIPASAEPRPVPGDAPQPPLLDVQIGAADPGGVPTGLTCPECGGVLWADPGAEQLHCRIGHRYSLDTLQAQRQLSVEHAMWAAVRALREDASLARHMATRARDGNRQHTAASFERRYRQAEHSAAVLEGLLLEREPAETPTPEEELSSS